MNLNQLIDHLTIIRDDCGGEGPGRYTEEEAVRLWNTRPPLLRPIDTLPEEYMFNQEVVMIKVTHGVVSAWFDPYVAYESPIGREIDGGMWIALDDDLQFEMDSVTHWAPLLEESTNEFNT